MIYPWNEPLWKTLHQGRQLPPALLLGGPRGTGKRAFAEELAKEALCLRPGQSGFACAQCAACRLLQSQSHPDYRLVEPTQSEPPDEAAESAVNASRFIVIAQIRDLATFLAVTAHMGTNKVVIIQPADKLHPSAANALLKTLEEPPPRTRLILVADDPQRLPATIRSRCFRLAFGLPDRQTALTWLRSTGIENLEVALAQGGFSPLAAAELEGSEVWGLRKALLEALSRDVAGVVEIVASAPAEHLPAVLGQLYRWCYDLVSWRLTGRLRYNPDHAKSLARLAVRADMRRMLDYMKTLTGALRSQEHPLNSRLVVEGLAVEYVRALAEAGH